MHGATIQAAIIISLRSGDIQVMMQLILTDADSTVVTLLEHLQVMPAEEAVAQHAIAVQDMFSGIKKVNRPIVSDYQEVFQLFQLLLPLRAQFVMILMMLQNHIS